MPTSKSAKSPAAKAASAVKSAKPAVKAKAAAPVAKAAKPIAIKDTLNKTGLVAYVAAASGQEPRAVKAVLAAIESAAAASLGKKGSGAFVLPGLLKVTAQKVPARKAYKGIDRFTKQERTFAAKPASIKVKVRALKKLRDAAAA